MPRMQLRAPGDAELICCCRRHQRWGAWVSLLPHFQPTLTALPEATQDLGTRGCTSLNSTTEIA